MGQNKIGPQKGPWPKKREEGCGLGRVQCSEREKMDQKKDPGQKRGRRGVGWAGCSAVGAGVESSVRVTSAVGGTTATADGHGPTGRDREGAQ